MREDSLRYGCLVWWKHWRLMLLGSVLVLIASAILSYLEPIIGRKMTVSIVGAFIILSGYYTLLRVWQDEARKRFAVPIDQLVDDARDIAERLEKFVELTDVEMKSQAVKQPLSPASPSTVGVAAIYLMTDDWLTQISHWEAQGRDVRHRVRIHCERLVKAQITTCPLGTVTTTSGPLELQLRGCNVLALRRLFRDHIAFLTALVNEVRKRGSEALWRLERK